MDFHKPKPFHSAREFLSELASVTVGILIALSLEAMIEQYRTDTLIDYARADFRVELEYNRDKLTADLKTMQDSQVALEKLIEAGRLMLAHKAPPTKDLTLSRTFVLLSSGAWTSALSTQVMGHFPHDEERALAEAYSGQEAFTSIERTAEEQWFSLVGYVGDSPDLDDAEIREGLHQATEAGIYLIALTVGEKKLLESYNKALKVLRR